MSASYVYEGIEVVPTGRTASRVLQTGKVISLREITPIDQSVGVWKRWVPHDELYKIDEGEHFDGV